MKIAELCFVTSFAGSLCLAQDLCQISTRLPPSTAAAIFEQIQVAAGFQKGTILLFTSSDQTVKDRSGAFSTQCPSGNGLQRRIVYDPALINKDLALYFALAHETAHHLNNDPMSGETPSKQQELRADNFAAQYLTRPPLNWTSEKLLQALFALPLPKEATADYPSFDERRASVLEGWAEVARFVALAPRPAPAKPSSSAFQSPTITAGSARVNAKDGLTYVWVSPGTFRMGCSPGDDECIEDEEPAHDVTITKGFWIGQTEVTQEAYQRVTGSNPSKFKGPKLPVETIYWGEAKAYCTAAEGRLPTEAEWELAARGGDVSARYGQVDEVAWYLGNGLGKTHEVAQKKPNALGLYDMLGNVMEWTANWYRDKPPTEAVDPKGPAMGFQHAVRGGSWVDPSWAQRASFRAGPPEPHREEGIGFRCVGDSP
jgi:sulfatase modifying factor 1